MNLIRFDKKNLLSLISIKMQNFFKAKVNTEVIKKPINNVVIDIVLVR